MPNEDDIYKPAEVEEDLPLKISDVVAQNCTVSNVPSKKISAAERKALEQSKTNQFSRRMKAVLTKYGLVILVAVLITLILLYVFDTILVNNNCKSSSLLSPLFELLKFIVSSLLGYVFANNLGKDINQI